MHFGQSFKRMLAKISNAFNAVIFCAFIASIFCDVKANMMGTAGDYIGVLFLIGAIGGTVFTMVSNRTAYIGTDPAVTVMCCVFIPVMAALGLGMLFVGRKGH